MEEVLDFSRKRSAVSPDDHTPRLCEESFRFSREGLLAKVGCSFSVVQCSAGVFRCEDAQVELPQSLQIWLKKKKERVGNVVWDYVSLFLKSDSVSALKNSGAPFGPFVPKSKQLFKVEGLDSNELDAFHQRIEKCNKSYITEIQKVASDAYEASLRKRTMEVQTALEGVVTDAKALVESLASNGFQPLVPVAGTLFCRVAEIVSPAAVQVVAQAAYHKQKTRLLQTAGKQAVFNLEKAHIDNIVATEPMDTEGDVLIGTLVQREVARQLKESTPAPAPASSAPSAPAPSGNGRGRSRKKPDKKKKEKKKKKEQGAATKPRTNKRTPRASSKGPTKPSDKRQSGRRH